MYPRRRLRRRNNNIIRNSPSAFRPYRSPPPMARVGRTAHQTLGLGRRRRRVTHIARRFLTPLLPAGNRFACVVPLSPVITCRAGESYYYNSSCDTHNIIVTARASNHRVASDTAAQSSAAVITVVVTRRQRQQQQQPIAGCRLPRFDWVTRAHTRSVGRGSVSFGRPLCTPHDVPRRFSTTPPANFARRTGLVSRAKTTSSSPAAHITSQFWRVATVPQT